MHPARLFIVCGLPGSGKTTRATEIAERFGALRLSADDWMEQLGVDIWDEDARADVEEIQGDLTMTLLAAGASAVIEWGTWTRAERDRLRDRAVRAGALVHLELLDAPVDVLWARVSARDRERHVGSRAITRAELEQWSTIIERPTADELASYDPMPPVRAGVRPASPAYPYGDWLPRTRPR